MRECCNCQHSRGTGSDVWCDKGHTTTYMTETDCPYYEEMTTLQDTLRKIAVKVAPMTPSEAHHQATRQQGYIERHSLAQVQSIELVEQWLTQAVQLSIDGEGTLDAWTKLVWGMREYQKQVLFDLYQEDILEIGGDYDD